MDPIVVAPTEDEAAFYRPFLTAFVIGLAVLLCASVISPGDSEVPAQCLNLEAWKLRCKEPSLDESGAHSGQTTTSTFVPLAHVERWPSRVLLQPFASANHGIPQVAEGRRARGGRRRSTPVVT